MNCLSQGVTALALPMNSAYEIYVALNFSYLFLFAGVKKDNENISLTMISSLSIEHSLVRLVKIIVMHSSLKTSIHSVSALKIFNYFIF